MPSLIDINNHERRSCKYQHDLVDRMRRSQYYVVEDAKRPGNIHHSSYTLPTQRNKISLGIPIDLGRQHIVS